MQRVYLLFQSDGLTTYPNGVVSNEEIAEKYRKLRPLNRESIVTSSEIFNAYAIFDVDKPQLVSEINKGILKLLEKEK